MPGKRSGKVAPGGPASSAGVAEIDHGLVLEVSRLLDAGQATPDAVAEIRARDPDRFDVTFAGMMDELARTDFHWFTSRVLKDQQTGNFFVPRPVDRIIQDHIDACKRDGVYAGLLAPVGLGKTWAVSIGRALWEVCQNPNILIKVICASDDTAVKRVKALSQIIMYDPDFRRIWGHAVRPAPALARSQEPWNTHQITVERGIISPEPTIEAKGILSSGAGARTHLIIFDDPIDEKTLRSPANRKAVDQKMRNEWFGRKFLGNHMFIYVCTRWADDDQSAVLMRDPQWRFLIIRTSDDFERLDVEIVAKDEVVSSTTCPLPTGWTPAMLKKEQATLGEITFNRLYKQKSFSSSDRLFKHLSNCYAPRFSMDDVAQMAQQGGWPCYVGVDFSGTRRAGNAIVVVAVDPVERKRYLAEARMGKWGSPEICAQLNDVVRRYQVVVVRVENNSVQELFYSFIQGDHERYPWARKVEPFTTTAKSKFDLETGIMTLDLEFQNGVWVLPTKHLDEHEYALVEHLYKCAPCFIMRQLADYPMHPSKDLVMAFWIARSGVDAYDVRVVEALKKLVQETPQDEFLQRNQLDW